MSKAISLDGDNLASMHLEPGKLINAIFLSAPAEVKKFEPRFGYCLLKVELDDGLSTFNLLHITAEQLLHECRIFIQKVGRHWSLQRKTFAKWISGKSPRNKIEVMGE